MTDSKGIFSSDSSVISLMDIKDLIKLCRYNPARKEIFFSGYEFADDLISHEGVVLYKKGREITPEIMGKIVELYKSNTSLVLIFKLLRTDTVYHNFTK